MISYLSFLFYFNELHSLIFDYYSFVSMNCISFIFDFLFYIYQRKQKKIWILLTLYLILFGAIKHVRGCREMKGKKMAKLLYFSLFFISFVVALYGILTNMKGNIRGKFYFKSFIPPLCFQMLRNDPSISEGDIHGPLYYSSHNIIYYHIYL